MGQELDINSWLSKEYHLAGPEMGWRFSSYHMKVSSEKLNFNAQTASPVLLLTLFNPVNDKHFQKFSRAIFVCLQPFSPKVVKGNSCKLLILSAPKASTGNERKSCQMTDFMTI